MADRNQQSPRQGVRLSQVYPKNDKTETDVDIIAIHGLDTKSPDTWIWHSSNPNRNINWLQDQEMLPTAFPTARIFTIDWPASLFKERGTIEMKITELARSLLLSIQSRHGTDESRPVLFIASCLGGIVLIQAIVIAARSEKKYTSQYTSLWRATRGIVFLATPFRGTAFQNIAEAAVTFLGGYARLGDKQVTELLDSVKASTCALEDLVGEFTQTYQQRHQPCELAIFYETGKGNLLRKARCLSWFADILSKPKLLVNSSSARLDIVPNPIPLPRPHNQMNKFNGPNDPGYIAVTAKIKIILREIYDNRPIDKADAWIREEYYTADMLKIDRLSGERLSMDQCYINLAIVEHPGHDVAHSEGSESDPFSLLARLKIETPDKNIQVELKTLFNPRKGPDGHTIQPRRIFIRGRAGVGKTTLCKKMVHDFKHHKNRKGRKDPIWNDLFDRVLWVPLRNLKRKPDKGYNLEGLFLRDFFLKTPYREHLAKELERELDVTKFGRTVLILDGLDEVSEGLDKDNEMHQFLKFLLEQPNVIITSRPFVRFSYNLHPDLELETIGFYPDQVNTYVDKAFTDPATAKIDPKAGEIRSFLQDHWLIQGLIRIPIQLDALCYTWNKSSLSEAAIETMTAMYEAIEHRLWKKDILRLEKIHNGKLVTENFIQEASRAKIEKFVTDEISFLECLAFAGLHNNIIDFGTEHRNAIADYFVPGLLLDQTLPCLSFLRRSNPSAEDYHFLHLTYQEYFAARYFIRQWTSDGQDLKWLELETQETRHSRPVSQDKAVSYLQEHKYNARYNVFWRFVAGLLDTKEGSETLHFFQTIEDEPRDLLGPVHQRLVMHCLSEIAPSQETSKFSQLRKYLEGQLKQWLLFECNFDFNDTGHSELAAEMEFPREILKDILQKESEDIKVKILNSLRARPRPSRAIIELVAPYLGNDVSIRLKTAALRMLQSCYSALPAEVVQAVAVLLRDPDEHVRSAAAEALRWQSALPEEVVQAVAALLRGPDKDVRSAAAEALRWQSALPEEVVQAMVALLRDLDEHVRSTAAEALRWQPALPAEVVQAVAVLLRDPDEHVRWAAAQALSRQSALPEEVVQAMVALLRGPDEDFRSAAAQALRWQPALPEEVVQAVAVLLRDPDEHVRSTAAQALRWQSALPEEVVQAVAALLRGPDKYVRLTAVQALRRQPALPEEVVQAVAVLLRDPDEYVRSTAAEALSRQPALPEEVVQAVAVLLRDPDKYVRSAAAEALRRQSALPEEVVQAVAVLLRDPDKDVRWAAAQALRRQSALPEEVVQAVAALLRGPDKHVRSTAVQVLRRQPALPEEVVQAVAALLRDPDKDVRWAAAQALRRQSALPEEVVQAVAALLRDPDKHVRSTAAEALSRQPALPEEVVQAVAVLLRDPDKYVRSTVSQVLGQQAALPDERFHYFLLKLDSQLFNNVYGDWLRRSFSDYLTWYVKGNNYSINLPEGSRHIPSHQLQNAVQEAQASLKVPIMTAAASHEAPTTTEARRPRGGHSST